MGTDLPCSTHLDVAKGDQHFTQTHETRSEIQLYKFPNACTIA